MDATDSRDNDTGTRRRTATTSPRRPMDHYRTRLLEHHKLEHCRGGDSNIRKEKRTRQHHHGYCTGQQPMGCKRNPNNQLLETILASRNDRGHDKRNGDAPTTKHTTRKIINSFSFNTFVANTRKTEKQHSHEYLATIFGRHNKSRRPTQTEPRKVDEHQQPQMGLLLQHGI